MRFEDTLLNWLQIHLVSQARPNDWAAQETARFFHSMLLEDHRVESIEVNTNEGAYAVHYTVDGEERTKTFDRHVAEQLIRAIQSDPKYNNQ